MAEHGRGGMAVSGARISAEESEESAARIP